MQEQGGPATLGIKTKKVTVILHAPRTTFFLVTKFHIIWNGVKHTGKRIWRSSIVQFNYAYVKVTCCFR